MVVLTDEERNLIDEGKISYTELIRQRAQDTANTHCVDHNALDEVKQKIKDANIRYREAIQKNKDLYSELEESRKAKEVCRNEIAALRIEKKKLLGIE